jgi:hypothetical protein
MLKSGGTCSNRIGEPSFAANLRVAVTPAADCGGTGPRAFSRERERRHRRDNNQKVLWVLIAAAPDHAAPLCEAGCWPAFPNSSCQQGVTL